MRGYTAEASVLVKADRARVWKALTDPEEVKQYLFGTQVESTWKKGDPIKYRGVWEGKPYEDKGKILEVEPGELLASTYWSSMSGTPDLPENYSEVRYVLAAEAGGTKLTILQDNNDSEESASHSRQNWELVLGGLKRLVEGA